MDSIPFLDLPRQHRPLLDDLNGAITGLVAEGRFIGGAPVAEFEQAFAEACCTRACVGVANGTDALMLALRALGVGAGDVVIVPAHTFIATAEAVTMVGAIPRLVDVDPVTYTMSSAALEAVDSRGVVAVIPVHIYGQSADLDPILATARARRWKVIEDAAQAHGAVYRDRPVASWGDLGCFSFYPGKNLGAFGDAGAVVGSDENTLDRLRRLADHGRQTKHLHAEPGVNSRLDSIQAAVLSIKLRHLGRWNAARQRVAAWYDERLAGLSCLVRPTCARGRSHVYHLYVVLVPERDALIAALAGAGISAGIHYATPLHLQPAYASLRYQRGDFPVAEEVSARCVSLPMFPDMSEAQVERVARVVHEHLQAGS
jgi:dTDP-4-amino-4,6-dideoxygalactose transaminase